MSNNHNNHIVSFDSVSLPLTPANDNSDWAHDLVLSFRVLREIHKRVIRRWRNHPTHRDARWLEANLGFLQQIWGLLNERGYTFTG